MASRTRRKWRPDPRGYYSRQIGWVLSGNGKKQQQKFLLGKNLRDAEHRERKLRELWDRFADEVDQERPLWPDDLLQVAKLVARGVEEISIATLPGETQFGYAGRIRQLQASHPVVLFVPADRYFYDVGCAALHCFDQIPIASLLQGTIGESQPHQPSRPRSGGPRPVFGVVEPAASNRPPFQPNEQVSVEIPRYGVINNPATGPTSVQTLPGQHESNGKQGNRQSLHDAMTAYQEFIQREYFRPEMDQLTPWGQTQKKQVESLKEHHENRLLIYLTGDHVNEMIGYWRRRPAKKGSKQPMKAKSASNYLGTLIRFFKWLDNSSSFTWSKPFAFSDANTRVQTLTTDHANRKLDQVETFSLQELKLLMRYAQPLDRLLLLLAINCGFGRAEISSLLIGEVKLFEAHSAWHRELLNYHSTDKDSFIKRVRRKSGVYGEHLLFKMTVQGIQWALGERKKQPGFSEDARLLLNHNGKPYDQPTKSGNSNQTIPNRLARLVKRIRDDGHELRDLSFGKLRKTAGQLIKTFSDGEVMGVFDCHGQPVRSDSLSDAYSNRPFGKVFKAILDVEKHLEPVFAEAGPQPFKRQAEAYTKRSTIDRIVELHKAGSTITQIASEVVMAPTTVNRHIQDHLCSLEDSASA